jgi:hypothetical protein
MIFIDTHVHIHPCFELELFLSAAADNFGKAAAEFCPKRPYQSVLCLADDVNGKAFDRLCKHAGRPLNVGVWSIQRTDECHSLIASHSRLGSLAVLGGRQIRCDEGIELLALGTGQDFEDGIDLQEAFVRANAAGALAVLPWGFGKWTGRRGKVVRQFLENRSPGEVSLGDNSGRPGFWREPLEFVQARRMGYRILPGSDPLPFPSEVPRVASFGLTVSGHLSESRPACDVMGILSDNSVPIRPFGQLERPWQFMKNQLAMQMVKRQRRQNNR